MFKHIPNGKGMVYGPNGKGIMASLKYTLIIYGPNGKGTALWNIVFPSGNRHGKRRKRYTKKIQCRSKINFMHYRNYITWTTVKLPVVFEEFYMVYIFWFFLSFYYYCQLVQVKPPSPPGFYGPEIYFKNLKEMVASFIEIENNKRFEPFWWKCNYQTMYITYTIYILRFAWALTRGSLGIKSLQYQLQSKLHLQKNRILL